MDVLGVDVLRKLADALLQNLGSRLHLRRIGGVVGVQQAVVCVDGKFCVDGQIHTGGAVARQPHGVFHALAAALHGSHVLCVLLRRKDLLQNRAQLDLSQNAARFHIAQNLFQVAHACCQRLHLAQALVYALQLLAHTAEGLLQLFVQRFLQLLVHSVAHLVQALAVVRLHGRNARFHRGADVLQLLLALQRARFHALLNELQLVRHGFLQRSLAHGKLFAQLPQAGVLRLRHLPLCVCLKLRRGLQRSVDGAAHLRAQRAHLFLQLL